VSTAAFNIFACVVFKTNYHLYQMFSEVKNKGIRIVLVFIYAVLFLFCAIEINLFWLFGTSPSRQDIEQPIQQIASEVYTQDSVLIGRYYKEDRTPIPFEQMGEHVVQALIATEDVRFYQHHGVDFKALASSVISTAQGEKRGGSTITQQLAKNMFRTRYGQSAGLLAKIPGVRMLVIKLKEWMTAYKLEARYSKQEILTMYLNTVSFSHNAYGINTVAKRYFDKTPLELTVSEAALLVGMLKGTTLYNPIRNPERSLERRNVVLGQMRKTGYLTEEAFQEALNEPLQLKEGQVEDISRSDSYLRVAVEKWLETWCEENDIDLYTSGLKIYTTIDSRLQALAEEAMQKQMKVLQDRLDQAWQGEIPWRDAQGEVIPDFLEQLAAKTPVYEALSKKFPQQPDSIHFYLHQKKTMEVFTWDGMQTKEWSTMDSLAHYATMLNTGITSLEPRTGHIKVWVGGIHHTYYKYDHVNQSKRQPGSTFKPFTYLAALEAGMSPCDQRIDQAVRIPYEEDGEQKVWEPKNADWVFTGRSMSLRWAMAKSVNSITAKLTDELGWDKVAEAAQRVGIESPIAVVPSVGLGSSDVSVLEMVNAYATFMDQGRKNTPILVEKIYDREGVLLEQFSSQKKQVITPENAWLMTYMLRGGMEEPEGTSQALWEWDLWGSNNQIGGKTGTSSDYVDGWYIGVTKDLVTGVWVGCDERAIHFRNSQTGEGSRTALPIFGLFMEAVYKDKSLPYSKGPFPEASVEISRKYNCPSPRIPKPDTLAVDSMELLPPPTRLEDTGLQGQIQSQNQEGQQEEIPSNPGVKNNIRIRYPAH
jgi:penicillin-binding protein 1A